MDGGTCSGILGADASQARWTTNSDSTLPVCQQTSSAFRYLDRPSRSIGRALQRPDRCYATTRRRCDLVNRWRPPSSIYNQSLRGQLQKHPGQQNPVSGPHFLHSASAYRESCAGSNVQGQLQRRPAFLRLLGCQSWRSPAGCPSPRL